jgi:integrase
VDVDGVQRERKGCGDRRATEVLAAACEAEVAKVRAGLIDAKTLGYRRHEGAPLSGHLADWRRDMEARGKTPEHAELYHGRASKLAALTRGADPADLKPGRKREAMARAARALAGILDTSRLSDLTPDGIQAALARLRDAGKSYQTINHYRAALSAFVRWAGDTGRLRDSPMRGVKGFNAEEDRRHERRALADDELARLITTADHGPERFGMPGPLRAMAYRVAAATGFRAEELRALTPESFRLDGREPSISLRASATKNRRPAEQPIPLTLAPDLAAWLAHVPARACVFPLHHETAKAIRRDLDAAGIPYETDAGVADFHSLRAYFVSALVRSGATIKEVQTLARHAQPQTTLNHYAKVSVRDLRGAVENLPVLPVNDRLALPLPYAGDGDAGHMSNRSALPLPCAGDGSGRAVTDAAHDPGNGERPETRSLDGFGRVLSASDGSGQGSNPCGESTLPHGLTHR